jgi:DNA-binding MarR family transcriptional regulator
VVLIAITPDGLDLLAGLDDMVNALNKRLLGHLDAEKLNQLLDLTH